MTDLQKTSAAIDALAVHECGFCRRTLPEDGPSRYYCNEACQAAYLAPTDLARDALRVESGGFATPMDAEAALAEMGRPFAHERLGHWSEPRRTERDEAAIERAQTGQWLARFAAPWHPNPATVRAEPPNGRPPSMLHAVRYTRLPPLWTAENESDMFDTTITQDTYRLESVDEHERSAIYRIQGLPGPRHAVFRWAADQPPTWWTQSAWEGRWVEIENGPQGHARGHRWNYPSGQTILASPTERYESREDGAVAEVWAAAPDREEMAHRAMVNRWRIMHEARISALIAPPDPFSFVRITGV